MRKKVNPRRRPASEADVKRERERTADGAVKFCMILFLTVMLDKEGSDKEQLQRIMCEIADLSDSVKRGYVNRYDLEKVLLEEYEIQLS